MSAAWVAVLVSAASLFVEVRGLRNTKGVVQIALFRSATGYPEDNTRAARTLAVAPTGATVAARFDGLEEGTWACAVLHDENVNGKLDKSFIGVPLEGIGASNAATQKLGVPSFEDARFQLTGHPARITLPLRYYW